MKTNVVEAVKKNAKITGDDINNLHRAGGEAIAIHHSKKKKKKD